VRERPTGLAALFLTNALSNPDPSTLNPRPSALNPQPSAAVRERLTGLAALFLTNPDPAALTRNMLRSLSPKP